MDNILISIIIPVYNGEKYLEQCIQSVLSIENVKMEVVLIDDGSTDSSGVICDKMATEDGRIRVYHKRNEGVSVARNLGIECASGEYLCFLDSDDIFNVKAFEIIAAELLKSHWDMFIAGFCTFKGKNEIIRKEQNTSYENLNGAIASKMLMHWDLKVCMGSFFVHRKSADNIRFSTAYQYGEDVEYIHKCLINSKRIKVTEDFLVLYRINEDSAIFNVNLHRYDNYLARKSYREYVQMFFPECQELIKEIDTFNIPECLADNISLMCRSKIPYKELVKYLQTSGIEAEMKRYAEALETEPKFRSVLNRWCTNPYVFYWLTRLEADYYFWRGKAGTIKRRLVNNGKGTNNDIYTNL